jgi:hypothetical protein
MNGTAQAAVVIQEHCKKLKLAAVVRDYPALCDQARDGGWAYENGARIARSRGHQSTPEYRVPLAARGALP